MQWIGGVVTLGRADQHKQWVTKYSVTVSSDEQTWHSVNKGQEFAANFDQKTPVAHRFIGCWGRYVRVHPLGHHGHTSMRVGLIAAPTGGCMLRAEMVY